MRKKLREEEKITLPLFPLPASPFIRLYNAFSQLAHQKNWQIVNSFGFF